MPLWQAFFLTVVKDHAICRNEDRMEYLVTAREMKQYDEAAIKRIGIPSMVLMERAALSVLDVIKSRRGDAIRNDKILILAGYGNNGGDGLALARLLCEAGALVEVLLCGDIDKASEEWKQQKQILLNYPVKTGSILTDGEYTVLIDALLGIGLSRDITGEYAKAIRWFNGKRGWKLAIDIPSGIHSDHGRIMGTAVKADTTVALAYVKCGLCCYPGYEYAGEIIVKDIGIGKCCFNGNEPEIFRYTEDAQELLPKRSPAGNKGTFGKILIAAGSLNMAGAAILSARSAYRTGAGMVKIISSEHNRTILQTAVPEALFGTDDDLEDSLDWADACVIGPGLGVCERAKNMLSTLLHQSGLPLVIDADALNILARDSGMQKQLALQGEKGREIIITPHMGELHRLTGKSMEQLKADPVNAARAMAAALHCIVVSKDARTLICGESGRICMNTSGNSGMATAGSGDVLTGMIGGLLVQGMEAFQAAGIGAYLHGLAGDEAIRIKGEHGLMAGDIIDFIGKTIRNEG